jgi:hypothetical protein
MWPADPAPNMLSWLWPAKDPTVMNSDTEIVHEIERAGRPRRLMWHHGVLRELHPTKGWRRA